MSCGKRIPVKTWDRPRNIRVIKPSRYEKNEASVKVHWKNVVHTLEMSYKDDQFWESNCETVRELVGPVVYKRIAKMFNLPIHTQQYLPTSPTSSVLAPSAEYYIETQDTQTRAKFSISDYEPSARGESIEEQSEAWTVSSAAQTVDKKSTRGKLVLSAKSIAISKLFSKKFSRFMMSKTLTQTLSSRTKSEFVAADSEATSQDDMNVYYGSSTYRRYQVLYRSNPYFEMLYCNESETDMIKWKSHYKQKEFEISASDEFSKRAEILSKQISKDFYDWWVGLGNVEFKSEIKRPEDIEDLFQVWFDEHASRGIMLHPKIIPCVLKSIAEFVGVPKTSCPEGLKRQIAYDIHAETSPAHLEAFGTCLPHHLAHVPPKNDTSKNWRAVPIPEDLRTMSCVWEEIQHLTSTKAFYKYLLKHPTMPMPPFFKTMEAAQKKLPFAVPSDFVAKDATSSTQDLALPVSQFSLELKEVLSKLMNK